MAFTVIDGPIEAVQYSETDPYATGGTAPTWVDIPMNALVEDDFGDGNEDEKTYNLLSGQVAQSSRSLPVALAVRDLDPSASGPVTKLKALINRPIWLRIRRAGQWATTGAPGTGIVLRRITKANWTSDGAHVEVFMGQSIVGSRGENMAVTPAAP